MNRLPLLLPEKRKIRVFPSTRISFAAASPFPVLVPFPSLAPSPSHHSTSHDPVPCHDHLHPPFLLPRRTYSAALRIASSPRPWPSQMPPPPRPSAASAVVPRTATRRTTDCPIRDHWYDCASATFPLHHHHHRHDPTWESAIYSNSSPGYAPTSPSAPCSDSPSPEDLRPGTVFVQPMKRTRNREILPLPLHLMNHRLPFPCLAIRRDSFRPPAPSP